MSTTALWHTTLEEAGSASAPLVVLLHGRGADERDIVALAERLPAGPSYVALRAPLAEGAGFAWFANQGIGRPLPASLATSIAWFTSWLDSVAGDRRPVVLVGFSGGATFAGGVVLADPSRYAGLASLYATLPFEAGVPTAPDRLTGLPVLLLQGSADRVIPPELQARSWRYLHDSSGATLTAHRSSGGHSLTESDVGVLGHWLGALPASPPAHDDRQVGSR